MDGAERTKSCDVEPTKRYRHQALDTSTRQIRLIKLRPGQSKQPQCDISVFDLSSAPPFLALSYTWGPPSPQFDILINGESLSIRENLFRFFQVYLMCTDEIFQRRPPTKWSYHWDPRAVEYLWIDQICIDQSRVGERNHQVGMMASIYAGCYGTIIWLGDIRDYPDAPLLLGDSTKQDYLHALRTLDFSGAIASISSDEYFTRLWIVQEIIRSSRRKVLCSHPTAGPIWMNWGQLCARAKCFPQGMFSESAKYLLDDHDQKKQMTLYHAIKTFAGMNSQDPRDKVYALMGLVKEEQRFQIDYGKSLEELLLDLMTVFFAEFTEFPRSVEDSWYDYGGTLEALGYSWGIMSRSLKAFLFDIWRKPSYDQEVEGKDGKLCEYPRIHAMGFLPNALNQDTKLKMKELIPYWRGQHPDNLELSEWLPTKDCWWYEVDGITYEIYGLISSSSLSDEDQTAWYYGKRVRQAVQ